MEFKRQAYQDLLNWKTKEKRKPLLVLGARQVGKTTLLKTFGREEYKDFLYINLERQANLHQFFEGDKNPQVILDRLSLVHGKDILSDSCLIVLDEIQECRDALIALKYFEEELPDIHIIGAGSLLGLSIGNERSFPVGKVEFLDLYPLTFAEYLMEADKKLYRVYNRFSQDALPEPLPEVFFSSMGELYKEYILFGGMPEVAVSYLENKNIEKAQEIQDQILRAYELDFVKHSDRRSSTKIQQVWNSLPSQLAKENKKFIYRAIRSGARAREYEEAIQWLIQAGLVYKVPRVTKAGIPLKAYEDLTAFKLYIFETGLLIRMAGLDPSIFINKHKFFTEFKGSIAENYVAQSLRRTFNRPPYYWTSDWEAEVDYIIELHGHCLPIEVKSGQATKAKSLSSFKKKYSPKLSVRISERNLKRTGDVLNIPLFYALECKTLVSRYLLSEDVI